ncbi:MAG TPA: hypothetical protein VGQ83_42440 [Polyangia bacterium]|jgi:hypothetical protein
MRSFALACTLLVAAAPAARGAGPAHQFGVPALSRPDFNRLAARADSPLFWVADRNGNGLIEPDELAGTGAGRTLAAWVDARGFTPKFVAAYQALVELRRQESVRRELDYARPTLVQSDFTRAPATERALLAELLAAAGLVEELYLRQTGGFQYWRTRGPDPASRMLVWRNHGPWCETPASNGDAFCNAVPSFPPRRSEAYPQDLPQDEAMCRLLQAQPNAPELLNPFTVVRRQGGGFVALPLTKAFGPEMSAVAARLRAAAAVIAQDPKEQPLRAYLLAAARGFETNDWAPADEAWAAMSAQNSAWYLRIAPDEVYFDPCQQKAGFHVSLGRIDQSSLDWQRKLSAIRTEMEQSLARLIGAPYRAREVRFHMPDFMEVVLNAGDSRHPIGGTIGQSLPNWGKVVQEGRGRTVVMSNLYTDPDSKRIAREQARDLLAPATYAAYSDSHAPFLLNTILHEATHNFGPFSDYRIAGKPAKEVFGGQLASTLEELKAQIGGMWYLDLLRRKGLVDEATLRAAYVDDLTWALGHISRGMKTPSGNAQPYSQLAAVIVGALLQDGAVTFKDGKFGINFQKLPGAIARLTKQVGRIKATGDVAAGRALVEHFVSGKGHALVRQEHITAVLAKYPKVSFRYSVAY